MASTLTTPVAQAISLLFDGNLGRLLNYGLRPGYGLLGVWNPLALFTNGEQGVWYDPSDFSTMFQDAAGTTPVTAVEQPVGLILDKSKGLVLGPELVTNGDFSNGTAGWTMPANATVTVETSFSGRQSVLKSANSSNTGVTSTQTISVVSGSAYEISCYAYAPSSNSGTNAARVLITSGASPTLPATAGYVTAEDVWQLVKIIVFASSTTLTVGVNSSAFGAIIASGDIAYFDNISVRELPGNHAYQSTTTGRPTLSARYNLLTKTEQFDDAAWGRYGVASIVGGYTSPIGTNTAYLLTLGGAPSYAQIYQDITLTAGQSVRVSVGFKQGSSSNAFFSTYKSNGNHSSVTVTWSGGVPSISSSSGASNISLVDLGNGWCYVSYVMTPNVSGASAVIINPDLNSSVYIWGADLRVANDGIGLPAYQRVNTATDYDYAGFPPYLKFDGTDDSMATGNINFTSTDKMTVFAGVRKLSGSLTIFTELSGSSTANSGTFRLGYDDAGAAFATFISGGTFRNNASTANNEYASPKTLVFCGIGDIAGDSATLRINGTQAAITQLDQGTGNFGNYPLFIGRRGGTLFPFNGHLYSLIVRGAQSSEAQILSAETYCNQKTGAY